MRGDTNTIKDRLDIAEIISGYTKLEKAGASYKARCPFHNEKTPSFFVSPTRQSYYCFGCGAKGDIFTFVEEIEGIDFKDALKMLAHKAGVELEFRARDPKLASEEEEIRSALEVAMQFFENELEKNDLAKNYLSSRGISDTSAKFWKLGYAPAEWRALYSHLLEKGFKSEIILKAGLAKPVVGTNAKEPYDVFRDRLIFPLFDASGEVIAFSGRALSKDAEPKYLNSPDTILFTKSEVLYGLDKAKDKIRKKNYAVLVEGQMDLVLSHQAGVDNTVASSGTAFTQSHLERLKRLSKRIILAFDGDKAGALAGEKASILALALGLEAKIAQLPVGLDPADLVQKDPEQWKEVLRNSLPAIEHILNVVIAEEKEARKLGKLIVARILPLIALLDSSVERSHFISLIAKKTGIKEDVLWDDLRKSADLRRKTALSTPVGADAGGDNSSSNQPYNRRQQIEERLTEVRTWLKELPSKDSEKERLEKEERELENNLEAEALREELMSLSVELVGAETSKDDERVDELTKGIKKLHEKLTGIEDNRKTL